MSTTTRITLDQYHAMIARGDFEPREEHHVELIRGEIVPKDPRGPMSPINPPHATAVDDLTEWSFEVLPRGAVKIRVQSSLGIPLLESEPEPDLSWLARRDYSKDHPTPGDVLLLIEVADTTLRKDRSTKAALYAEAGIQDYWVVNIPGRCVEVFRDPEVARYRDVTAHGIGAEIRPLAFPGAVLPVDRIFPGTE